MYPRNAAAPERIAVGAIYLIADGTIQTTSVLVRVMPQGGVAATGGGTLDVDTTSGIWYYTPTQAETNYTSFMVFVYKASCTSASVTVVTTASSVPGNAQLAASQPGVTFATLDVTGACTHGSTVLGATTMGTLTQTGAVSWGATSFASLDVVGALTAGSVSIDTTMDVVGALTCASFGVDGALSVGTTTTLTGAVSAPAGIAANITGNLVGTVSTVTTLTGHTAQTGDTYALANGATGFVAIDTVVDAIKVKTDFLPSATAGAAGGVFIAGTNAPVTITGTGNALTLTSSGLDGSGLAATGNGAGSGIIATAGATAGAVGMKISATAASQTGLLCEGTLAGATLGGSVTGYGLNLVGAGTSHGLRAVSGLGATGNGIHAEALSTNGSGMVCIGTGSGSDILADITGNITGNLVGTVSTVTTLTNLPAITTNWLTAAGLATDAVTEIQSGLATAAALATVDANVDAILLDTGTDGVVVAAASKTGYTLASTGMDSVTLPANIITATSIAADAITSAKIADDAIGDEHWNVTAVAGCAVTSLATAAITDVWSTDTLTEAYAADGAAGTPAQILYMIQQALTEFAITSTTLTVKKLDGSTTAATYTLDSATIPTSRTRVT